MGPFILSRWVFVLPLICVVSSQTSLNEIADNLKEFKHFIAARLDNMSNRLEEIELLTNPVQDIALQTSAIRENMEMLKEDCSVRNSAMMNEAITVVGVSGCYWNMEDFPESYHMPLILDVVKESIVRPQLIGGKRIVSIPSNTRLIFACTGDKRKDNLFMGFDDSAIEATCKADGTFEFKNKKHEIQKYKIENMGCIGKIKTIIKKEETKSKCGGRKWSAAVLYEIGFQTSIGFFSLIQVCFEPNKLTTLWTKHTIPRESISARDRNKCQRPSFKNANTFPSNVDSTWTWDAQDTTLYNILTEFGIHPKQGWVDNFFSIQNGWYFAKGHLSPHADFVTEAEQFATYYYVNTLPQWQVINNGNWKRIEDIIRNKAASSTSDLTIITGGLGILKLKDSQNNAKDIAFGMNMGEPEKYPVPYFTWKIVKEENVAFVTINNPHIKKSALSPQEITIPLTSICNQIDWLNNQDHVAMADPTKGLTYCYNAIEFNTKLVPYIPLHIR